MALGIGKGILIPLLLLNFCLYLIAASIAGAVLNSGLDRASRRPVSSYNDYGNAVTPLFITITLITCMVGLASTLAGLSHVGLWRNESWGSATAVSFITWPLTLLALGLASKEINIGGPRSGRLKTVEAFMIIVAFFELVYLMTLLSSIATRNNNVAGPRSVNDPKYGAPAAASA